VQLLAVFHEGRELPSNSLAFPSKVLNLLESILCRLWNRAYCVVCVVLQRLDFVPAGKLGEVPHVFLIAYCGWFLTYFDRVFGLCLSLRFGCEFAY
jgi:hypothetical protein